MTFVPLGSEEELERYGRGLLECSLTKEDWTHRAHFAAALWLMVRRPEMELTREMPGLIRRFNESVGGANTDTSGYHETITQASLRAAREFLAARPEMPLFAVCNELMESPLGKSDWLLRYWSRERLFSVEARKEWVEPDVEALSF
jgi:hypothetical protein